MKKQLALLAIVVFSLLLVQSVSAIQFYLRPPKMILYTNVTATQPGRFSGFLEVRNNNTVPMNASFNTTDDLTEIIDPYYEFIVLEPGEIFFWNFTGKVYKVGRYEGKVNVIYQVPDFPPVNLDSQISVVASGEDVKPFSINPVIIGAVALVVLAGSGFFILKRRQ